MKYRPLSKENLKKIDIANEDIPDRKESEWQTKTYKIKVITPIYGGGVNAGEPDTEMPIRASAIRGQLRYWWRFLAMNRDIKPLEGEDLFKEERRIWGGMGDEKELKESSENDFSSKVFIRITNITDFNNTNAIEPCGAYERKTNPNTGNISYRFKFNRSIPIPPYSLFCAQGKSPKAGGDGTPEEDPHNIIRPGITFDMNISILNNDDFAKIEEAVKWWICFGGIGARTRRGLGSVHSDDIEVLDSEDVIKYGCLLEKVNATSAINAWNTAIKKLQKFRQSPEGRNGMGRSKWPEPDSIRDITTNRLKQRWQHEIEHESIRSFPRAAFGLPIIFEIRGGDEPPKTQLEPVIKQIESPRMSSTIILKALKIKDDYKAIALRLPVTHLDDLTVKLDYVNLNAETNNQALKAELKKCLPLEFNRSGDNSWWPINIKEQKNKAQHIDPMTNYNNAVNTLDAFMTFFSERGNN